MAQWFNFNLYLVRGIIAQLMTENLKINSLKVAVNGTQILHGINLTIAPGEVHAVMGPNGSGKSTMAASLAGHPDYEVLVGSELKLGRTNLLDLSPDERMREGLFLAFQYPKEIPGVIVQNFLRHAYESRFEDVEEKKFESVLVFRKHLAKLADDLKVDQSLLLRGLNEGFSGGEKKRLEILQMAVLEPKFAILDETDSGLDVDAIKDVAMGVKEVIARYNTGVVVITHYQRILDYLKPDHVHVMIDGQIVQSGGSELAQSVEVKGYRNND